MGVSKERSVPNPYCNVLFLMVREVIQVLLDSKKARRELLIFIMESIISKDEA
jgi:hypothetical protein